MEQGVGEIACLPRDEQVPSEQLAELLRAHELDPALAPVRCLVAGLGVTMPEVPSESFDLGLGKGAVGGANP